MRQQRMRTDLLASVRCLDGVSQRLLFRDALGGRVEIDPEVLVRNPRARRRAPVAAVAARLRERLAARGLQVMGDVVCPVVPVLTGDTPTGRTASGLIARPGLIAHLVEQPAVACDAARFRLRAMAEHGDADIDAAVDILDTCIRTAQQATVTSS